MKRIIVFAIALLISGISYGQFHIGPQIGYSGSNLTLNTDTIANNLKSNLLIGVFARFGKKIYVQPEVNWLTQGSVFKYPSFKDGIVPLEQEIKLSTIQVPVNVGWRFLNLKVVQLRVFAGIAANFVMNTKIDTKSGDADDYENALIPDDFKNVQWQWDVGAGVDILMFAVDVKYMGGINNLLDNVQVEGNSITSKSNLFVVTLGWKIL